MVNLLLTSNGFFTDEIKEQFLQLTKGNISNMSAGVITTASQQKENNKFAIKAKQDFDHMGIKSVEFIDIEFESAEKFEKYNIIYINGGNPFYLLHHIRKSGADLIFKRLSNKNVIIVGVSAGAVVLGPNINVVNYFTPQLNIVETKDLTGLEMTNKMIFPHYDREDLFPDTTRRSIEERLIEFENLNKCNVVRIKDDQFVLINN
ncbi:Type 1 glutamine amidotransferase-like domain-containing protein [Gottfriedia acidiceleris]|uniref:Type 1 glutamine amidotransferase-like domain-containing protein n=1 Tax=Gottfriedia acidiceleris TaxID=371036 RepID=UPI000B443C23|nr:Type 1 glutamine amidotransferase-like domain-containing protein [Gottfriedia acidiceleris]